VTAVEPPVQSAMPAQFSLLPNFPNPFNPATRIVYYAPHAGRISMKVYSITGSEIGTLVDGEHAPGEHQVVWTPEGISSGTYLCRMQAGKFSQTIKLLYAR
jgi:hypothetical protein